MESLLTGPTVDDIKLMLVTDYNLAMNQLRRYNSELEELYHNNRERFFEQLEEILSCT